MFKKLPQRRDKFFVGQQALMLVFGSVPEENKKKIVEETA